MALLSCPSAMLYYWAVITREVITGIYYILYTVTLLMILFGDGG